MKIKKIRKPGSMLHEKKWSEVSMIDNIDN